MKTLAKVLPGLTLLIGLSSIASAGQIDGSVGMAGVIPSCDNLNLLLATNCGVLEDIVLSPGTGDYSPIVVTTIFSATSLDFSDFTTFSFSNANYGTFDTVQPIGSGSYVITQDTSNFDVFLLGTFTPGSGLAPGLTATLSGVRLSINVTGESFSEGITMNTPPPNPEPATMVLLGSALVALGIIRRRKV